MILHLALPKQFITFIFVDGNMNTIAILNGYVKTLFADEIISV